MYQDHLWDVRPNTTMLYNTAIAALAKCGDVRRAEQILPSIKAMQHSLAQSGDNDAPDKEITILSKMKKHLLHNNDDGDDGYK
eukprot:13896286-Ditylum_brightwellii.AAC.1